jgi:alanyl-tRNA synthetase
LLKITQETSVSAGVRRIEAVTSVAAKQYYDDHLAELQAISGLIKNTKSTLEGVRSLLAENQDLKKSIEAMNEQQAGQLQQSLKGKVKEAEGVKLLIEAVPLQDMASIKTLAFNLEKELGDSLILLASEAEGKANLTLMISKTLTESKGWNAGNLIREWAKEIKGGGGGQPFFATAGGKDPLGISNALDKARTFAKQSVAGA